MPAYSPRHYAEIASVIHARVDVEVRDYEGYVALRGLAKALAETFMADNPRFDFERFMDACGLGDRFQINRVYKVERPLRVIERHVTLAEAQAHCKDPSTSTDEYMDTYAEEG